MQDLNALAQECMAELDAIHIPYSKNVVFEVNSRAKRRWGLCSHLSGGLHRIQIAKCLLEDGVPLDGAKNTVIHELLHTCPGTNGHKGLWKEYAEQVNRAYGYNIKRVSSSEEKGLDPVSDDDAMYVLKCTRCEATWRYFKLTNSVRNYKRCHCPDCFSPLELVKGTLPKTASGQKQRRESVQYRFVCTGCGGKINRKRASKFTRNYTNYRCKKCHSAFKQIM